MKKINKKKMAMLIEVTSSNQTVITKYVENGVLPNKGCVPLG